MRNQCLLAAGDDDDGVGRDAPVLGAPGLEPEALLQVDELRDVAVRIDPVDVDPATTPPRTRRRAPGGRSRAESPLPTTIHTSTGRSSACSVSSVAGLSDQRRSASSPSG